MSTQEPFVVPPGSVVITPTELYREMQATHNIVSDMRADLRELARAIPDHETRLRAVEDLAQDTAASVRQHHGQLGEVVTGRRYRITTTVAVLAVILGCGSFVVALIAVLGGN